MKTDLNQVQAFVRVCEFGSFSKAAQETGIAKSTLSRQIADLEKTLGLTLIQRTTRRFSLTVFGENYYRQSRQILSDLDQLNTQALAAQDEPQGFLRFSAPIEAGTTILAPALAKFAGTFPQIELDVVLTDRVVDLVSERFDVAFRAGTLSDTSLKAKKIGLGYFVFVRSPKYKTKSKILQNHKDLQNEMFIGFWPDSGTRKWTLKSANESFFQFTMPTQYKLNSLAACKSLCLNGMGIALLPYFSIQAELESKQLIRVLPHLQSQTSPFSLVYPNQKFLPKKTRVFIDFLSQQLTS